MIRRPNEINDLSDQGMPGELPFDGRQPLLERPIAVEQHPIGAPHALDVVARTTTALHAHDVDAAQRGAEPNSRSKRDNVGRNTAHAADHGAFADPDELMDRDQAAEKCVVTHHDMTAEYRVVREG